MKVKIDTKEKMHVITVLESSLSANMTEEMQQLCLSYLDMEASNLVISLEQVAEMEEQAALSLVEIQKQFYAARHSLVFCMFQKQMLLYLEKLEILEILNYTPTESEAWDIVQMEEIEREIL